MYFNHLAISWSTSRGQGTYGYNICRLDDRQTGHRFRCMGGGYDMIGTVFGNWLESAYQGALVDLVEARADELTRCGYSVDGYWKHPDLYGLTLRPDGTVSLDGACGISCMAGIARAIGLSVQREGNRKGHTVGYFVSKATPVATD